MQESQHKNSSHSNFCQASLGKFYEIPVDIIHNPLFFSSGVIELLGGAGGLVEFKASLLASRGFAALALAYFDYDDLPEFPPSMDIDYFEEAANWLSGHPKVLPHGIGVHSICAGSWISLLMASLQMKAVKAVVAISPVQVAFLLPFHYKGRISDMLHFIDSKKSTTEEGCVWRDAVPTDASYSGYSGPPGSKYSAITPVEKISCPVLLVSGTGDLNVNTDFVAKFIFDRLKENGKEHLCSILRYPEAGHLIEPPYSPLCYASHNRSTGKVVGDYYLVWGGEVNAHARAQEDAWPKVLSFLRKHIQNVKCHL